MTKMNEEARDALALAPELLHALLGALPLPLDLLLGGPHSLLELAHTRLPLALGDAVLAALLAEARLGVAQLRLGGGEPALERRHGRLRRRQARRQRRISCAARR